MHSCQIVEYIASICKFLFWFLFLFVFSQFSIKSHPPAPHTQSILQHNLHVADTDCTHRILHASWHTQHTKTPCTNGTQMQHTVVCRGVCRNKFVGAN